MRVTSNLFHLFRAAVSLSLEGMESKDGDEHKERQNIKIRAVWKIRDDFNVDVRRVCHVLGVPGVAPTLQALVLLRLLMRELLPTLGIPTMPTLEGTNNTY